MLPHVLTVDEAMADDAPILHEGHDRTKGVDAGPRGADSNVASRVVHERGDLDQGFAEADLVIERTFTTKPVHQGYIEPHAAVADANQEGRATVWCSSQGHFAMRTYTAKVLAWDSVASSVKVTPAEIGGGFGGKTVIYLEPLATMLSVMVRSPGPAGHGPRRGLPGLGPDLGHQDAGQDRRHQRRHHHRGRRAGWPTRPAPTPALPSGRPA